MPRTDGGIVLPFPNNVFLFGLQSINSVSYVLLVKGATSTVGSLAKFEVDVYRFLVCCGCLFESSVCTRWAMPKFKKALFVLFCRRARKVICIDCNPMTTNIGRDLSLSSIRKTKDGHMLLAHRVSQLTSRLSAEHRHRRRQSTIKIFLFWNEKECVRNRIIGGRCRVN